jgi:hypothetical protein
MRETMEFRIPEDKAQEFLLPGDGVCLGGSVRKVTASVTDPLTAIIASIQRELRERGEFFFLGWKIHRRYSQVEIRSAEAFMIEAKRWVEPCGEECGTIYDESNACKYCGSQERQASDLILDAGSLPKSGSLALAMTIGRETIVSEAFVRLFESNEFSGAFLVPLRQKGARLVLSLIGANS